MEAALLQSWLSAAGITIDLLGFALLLREWWLAFFHESSALEFAKQQSWQRKLRHQHQTHAPDALRAHLDTTARLQDEMAERSVRETHLATLRSRKRAFLLATVLIVLGSLLQLAGALPEPVFALAVR